MKLEDEMPTSMTPNQDQTNIHSFASWQPIDDWTVLTGQDVEVHTRGSVTDRGRVEAVMADGSLLWLMQDGAHSRRVVEQQPGTYIRRTWI
ncbi:MULTISPECIES: hypothetical protein [Bacteria]|jgi:hypothetical protein|nr:MULTISPECIES: hypothetical protein [Micrococcaceae]MBD1540454.1 hypothetical protein [Arthrobacter sp. S13_S34]NHW49234.1 hypothetical protein [Paenarthrobacter sp. MSM-2-10-13]NSX38939.1 hypothetical protein [Pseudarthrobacter oxydans]WIV33523.1 hypothetical protein QN084_22935 [Paenarthrobacter sp. R1]